MANRTSALLAACADLASRRPWLVLALSLLLTAAAAFASAGLTIDARTENILSPSLPFRQAEQRYRAEFPKEELAVAIVDAGTAAEAGAAAEALVARLEQRPDRFERVDLPGSGPYFERYGLLFLAPERLEAVGTELRQARRLLMDLAADPTLRGVAGLVGMAQAGVAENAAPPELAGFLARLAETVEARAEGRDAELDWQAVFGMQGDEGSARRIVRAKPILDNSSLDRAGPAIDAMTEEIAALRAEHPSVTVQLTGDPVLRQQELNDAFSGALAASGLSFVLVALSLILGIRSGRLIVALLVTLVIGSIWTAGLAAVTVGRLNLISVAFLVLFFGLGVDFGTHLGLRHLEEVRKGAPFGAALKQAMLGEGPGILLSALCAALAFLSFVPTAYTGLAEFGIISALGMAAAVVVTFTLQPALMALMPPRAPAGAGFSIGLGGFVLRRHRAILVVALAVSVAAGFFVPRAGIDVNPLNLQNPEAEPVRAWRDLARDPDTSPYALDVLAADRDAARELQPELAAIPGVSGVRWVEDFIPADQERKLQILAGIRERMGARFFRTEPEAPAPTEAELATAFEELRTSAAAIGGASDATFAEAGRRLSAALDRFAAQQGLDPDRLRALGVALAGGMPALVSDLRERLSVEAPVTFDDLPPDLTREWIAPDGRVRLHVMPAEDIGAAADMEAFAERVQAVAPDAYGVPTSVTGAGHAILASFAEAVAYTVLAVAFVMFLWSRRAKDVFLVLLPLAVASLWTVAASALLDLPFNFANVIVIPLLVGLGVASSVHIVARAREAHEEHARLAAGNPRSDSDVEELRAGVLETSTPLAVLVAQLNTAAAFATLAISDHRGLYSMGLLLGIAILFVLIASLVVLPALLVAIERRGARQ